METGPKTETQATDAQTRSAAAGDTQADVAAINAVRDREVALAAAGNADSMLAIYSNDVVMMPPNEPALNGHDAVKKWAETMFRDMNVTVRYASSDVTVAGDWAIDRYTGVFGGTPKAGGQAMEEKIKGVHILKRQSDGSWRITQDVWNSDAPPPAASAPPRK